MQVITTHLNADFDCLASMVAAKKLYPEARMVFSGSAEKMVQDGFFRVRGKNGESIFEEDGFPV
jgi:tRNA nucleotidyltransferase (CCA-adding enzyme)